MPEAADINEKVILIKIPILYRENMSEKEKYEATRGIWKIGTRRENAEFAFSVFENIIVGVYKIDSWHPALSTPYETRSKDEMTQNNTVSIDNRFEFIGHVSKEMENKYLGKTVLEYFPQGAANPIKYVNC